MAMWVWHQGSQDLGADDNALNEHFKRFVRPETKIALLACWRVRRLAK